ALPVPPAVAAAPARRTLLPSRRVRRARDGRPRARVHARRGGAARSQLLPRQAPGRSCRLAPRSGHPRWFRAGGPRYKWRRLAPHLGPPTEGAGPAAFVTVIEAPILMTFAFAALVAGALLCIPKLIAPRRLTPVKAEPFECGKDPIAVPEGRFAIKFSTVAIFFILIDIELMFVWPWAV